MALAALSLHWFVPRIPIIDYASIPELKNMDHYLVKSRDEELKDFFTVLNLILFFTAIVFINMGILLNRAIRKMKKN